MSSHHISLSSSSISSRVLSRPASKSSSHVASWRGEDGSCSISMRRRRRGMSKRGARARARGCDELLPSPRDEERATHGGRPTTRERGEEGHAMRAARAYSALSKQAPQGGSRSRPSRSAALAAPWGRRGGESQRFLNALHFSQWHTAAKRQRPDWPSWDLGAPCNTQQHPTNAQRKPDPAPNGACCIIAPWHRQLSSQARASRQPPRSSTTLRGAVLSRQRSAPTAHSLRARAAAAASRAAPHSARLSRAPPRALRAGRGAPPPPQPMGGAAPSGM